MKMKKTIKTADLNPHVAAELFESLNPDVEYLKVDPRDYNNLLGVIVTDVNPEELVYPEGWYFAKGVFRNKHNSSSGVYWEIPIVRHDGIPW